MAKGQLRRTKEPKKPKADKAHQKEHLSAYKQSQIKTTQPVIPTAAKT